MPKIKELAVHCLDGEFYADTRKYLEKRGCVWTESRKGDQLVAIYLTFPPGTVYKERSPINGFRRYEITFEKGGMLWWHVKQEDQLNRINVPYAYLGG